MNRRIVFIDWDGTLSFSKFWGSLKRTDCDFSKVVDDFFAFEKETLIDWMKGLLTSEEVNRLISRRSKIQEKDLWQIFVSDCQNIEVDPYAMALIQKIRAKDPVVLITGNMDCFTRFTVPALRLNDQFDLIVNSADVGCLKTDFDGKSFVDCIRQFKIENSSDAYLVEDSEKTCEVFRKLGGNALRVDNPSQTIAYLEMLQR